MSEDPRVEEVCKRLTTAMGSYLGSVSATGGGFTKEDDPLLPVRKSDVSFILSRAGGTGSGEVAWLIEDASEPKWWTGWPGAAGDAEFWTRDSLAAIHFSRRWDAEEFARLAIMPDLTIWSGSLLPWLGQAGALAVLVLLLWIGIAGAAYAALRGAPASTPERISADFDLGTSLSRHDLVLTEGVEDQPVARGAMSLGLLIKRGAIASYDFDDWCEYYGRAVRCLAELIGVQEQLAVEINDIVGKTYRYRQRRGNRRPILVEGRNYPILERLWFANSGTGEDFGGQEEVNGGRFARVLDLDLYRESQALFGQYDSTIKDYALDRHPWPMLGLELIPSQIELALAGLPQLLSRTPQGSSKPSDCNAGQKGEETSVRVHKIDDGQDVGRQDVPALAIGLPLLYLGIAYLGRVWAKHRYAGVINNRRPRNNCKGA